MAYYRVTLKAKTSAGPLNIESEREFIIDGADDGSELTNMFYQALRLGWECEAVPVVVRNVGSVVDAFRRTIALDTDF